MKKIFIILSVLLAMLVIGCGSNDKESNNSSQSTKQEIVKTKAYDFTSANKLLKEDIKNNEKFVKDFTVNVDEKKKQITISVVVNDSVNDKYILELIDSILRKYNMYCSAGGSSKDKWGNLYDEYGIMIGIATPTTIDNSDKWLIFDAVAPKVQTKHQFKVKRK